MDDCLCDYITNLREMDDCYAVKTKLLSMCTKLYNIFSFLFWYVGLNLCRVMLEAAGITKILGPM
jgi:hypothetical protein